jgi:transposase
LMRDLGLTPSESSTGDQRRPGALTTTGHAHARRARIDGAWAYRYPANVSRHLPWRLEQRPTAVQAMRWKAPVRLGTRSRHLSARALRAFLGAMGSQVPVTPQPRASLTSTVSVKPL